LSDSEESEDNSVGRMKSDALFVPSPW
jgi:hypothetical protein